MRVIGVRDMARIALYFAAETETFPVFKDWAIEQSVDETGRKWAESLTIEELRGAGVALHLADCHGEEVT